MSGSKAILVNPPNPPHYVSNKDSMGGFGQLYPEGAPPFPPLDLPYLAAVLTAHSKDVEILEAGALHWTVNQLCDAMAKHAGEDVLVVVRTSLPTIDWDLEVCAALKERGKARRIAIYGPVTKPLLWRVQQAAAVDYAILGEPDHPVVDLLDGVSPAEIAGLVWRDAGGWHRNEERKFEKNLDSIPFPRWDLMPVDRYRIPKSAAAGTMRFLPMLTSRGCPFGCNYCPYPVGQGLPWRYRSPQNVVDELEHLVRDLGVEYVIFRDPLFSANKKRVAEICDEIIRRGVKVQWRCETRIDCLDEPTIAIMARAGCTGVNFGVESSDPEIQKNAERKPITERQFVETIAMFRRHGVTTFAFFVVGLPGDTVDTILATIAFALKLKASWTQFTVATPFIGTRLHDWAVEQGLVGREHYQIISSHEGSIGNENLSPRQVHLMHRFAQILQRDLINRRGVLKNENRRDPLYRSAKGVTDAVFDVASRLFFAAGSGLLRLTLRSARRGPATTSSLRARPRPAGIAP
jgi:anaerobic magnesium-protoporphyrin IX monomethyl ester cyclase